MTMCACPYCLHHRPWRLPAQELAGAVCTFRPMSRVAAVVFRISPELVLALDERLGPPVDSYVNGSQTWFTDDGPGDVALEWRLHPVSGYRIRPTVSHYDVWEAVVAALSAGRDAADLGGEERAPSSLWDGLECFAAYGDDIEPQTLAAAVTDRLGRPPDATGLVDHEQIGDAWEKANGNVSIVELLIAELTNSPDR